MEGTSLLYNSIARVERLVEGSVDGLKSMGYVVVTQRLRCRLAPSYIRPGKDAPPPWAAGRAADRTALMFCEPDEDLKPGDKLVMIPNDYGRIPVAGNFQMHNWPDPIQGHNGINHLEVQLVEVAQNTAKGYSA